VRYLRVAAVLGCVALIVWPPEALVQTLAQRWVTQAARPGGWRQDARVEIWSRAVDLWLERPLTGHGLGNSFFGEQFLWQLVYGRATLAEIAAIPEEALTYRADGYFMAHDTVLQLLIEVGLFGAIAFFLVYGYFLRDLWRLRRVPARGTAAVAATLLVAILIASLDGLAENNFLTRDFGTFYWFLVGLVCSLARRQEAFEAASGPLGGPSTGVLELAGG
jgi:O-antigen ligase